MKAKILYAIILILLVGFLVWDSNDTQIPAPSVVTVKEVIDGDTFRLSSNKTIRIAGIDTPEKGEPYADNAENLLKRLILGKSVRLAPTVKSTDRYNRLLAEVYIDSLNIGRMLLDSGYARLYLFDDNIYLKDLYLPAQVKAIEISTGIWSLKPPPGEGYYFRTAGSYRFHRPLCPNLKRSSPDNLIRLDSRLAALKQGLAPCRNCKP